MSSHNDSFVASGTSPTPTRVSPASSPASDLIFENHGSLFLIHPFSQIGQHWLDEHVADDKLMWGVAVVCEPRFVEPIWRGAVAGGLVCR